MSTRSKISTTNQIHMYTFYGHLQEHLVNLSVDACDLNVCLMGRIGV